MQAVLFLTFKGYAGSAHLRHAERVVCFYTEHVLDAPSLLFRMRLRSDNQRVQPGVAARVDSHLLHYFVEPSCITGNGMEGGCPEIGDEFYLPFSISGCGRYREHPETFRTVLESEPAGEHAVSRRVLENVAWAQAYHIEASGYGIRPFIQIFLRMQYDCRSACRSA